MSLQRPGLSGLVPIQARWNDIATGFWIPSAVSHQVCDLAEALISVVEIYLSGCDLPTQANRASVV